MTVNTKDTTIGFIGIGVMGKSMALHLMAAGYRIHVYTRTREKAEELMNKGAIWQNNPGSVARTSDVIITIVGYPKDVEDLYLSENGILTNCKAGNITIDMTTSSPQLAAEIYKKARMAKVSALDAPVSGGDVGAREARLSIMVGGDEEAFQTVKPLFEIMGQNVVHQGKAGAGQHCKMANQIAIASTMMGVCEAIRYAEKSGLNPQTVLASIEKGAAGSWSLSNLAPRIINGDFEPGFYIKHFIKDMNIALDSCESINLQARGLPLAQSLYEELATNGYQDNGTQALYKIYK